MAGIYLVLHNKNATNFADTAQGISVNSHTVPVYFPRITKRIGEAIKGGHVREIEKEQAETLIEASKKKQTKTAEPQTSTGSKEKTKEELLAAMTPDELLAYYKENFEVGEKEEKAFLKLKPAEKVKFLLDDEEGE